MKVGIIAGSVREGGKARAVALWVEAIGNQLGNAQYQVIDLADFDIPLLSDPTHPRLAKAKYASEAVQRWSEAIADCDAYVFVTPEYNHSIPGAFKNAVDSISTEWVGKPVAFVSYGSAGGVRAVEHWRQILATFGMYDQRAAVELDLFSDFNLRAGTFTPAERKEEEAKAMLEALVAVTEKLK